MISCQEQHGEELPYQVIGGVSHKCTSHTSGLHHCLCQFQSITPPTDLSLSHPPPDFNLSFSSSCLFVTLFTVHALLQFIKMDTKCCLQFKYCLLYFIKLYFYYSYFCYAVSFQFMTIDIFPVSYAYFTKLRSIALKTINNLIYVGNTFIMAQHQNDGIIFN